MLASCKRFAKPFLKSQSFAAAGGGCGLCPPSLRIEVIMLATLNKMIIMVLMALVCINYYTKSEYLGFSYSLSLSQFPLLHMGNLKHKQCI